MKTGTIRSFLLASILAASSLPATAEQWESGSMNWSEVAEGPVDLSNLLEGPAGAKGFVQVKAGHLADGSGKRIRFWGVNVTGGGCLPQKSHAPALAQMLARRGINCVRFHMLDGTAPRGLIKAGTETSAEFDPEAVDKLDFFVSELKRIGIYSDLNLNVARRYRPGDQVRDHALLGFAKSVTFFDERLLQLQRDYARQLLTHVNPYTGLSYAQEPAVALVELVNENSLIEAWFGNRLLGQCTNLADVTWTDITPSYGEALTRMYNAWLNTNVPAGRVDAWRKTDRLRPGEPIPRLRPAEFNLANPARFEAEARFYLEIEARFYTGMATFLREDLKVKALLIGNSDHGHSKTGYPQLIGSSLLDVVDGHVYWQHPRYLPNKETGKRGGFEIRNTAMVNDPLHSTVVELARSAVAGKPYTVSEVNHPFPAENACEGIPILAAYAALQDWDGIFWYTFTHSDVTRGEPLSATHFDLAPDPLKMAQIAAGALMFLRGDVASARNEVSRGYSREQVIASIRLPQSESPFFDKRFPAGLALQSRVRISGFEEPLEPALPMLQTKPFRSDTGELTWFRADDDRGRVVVGTANSEAAAGHLDGGALNAPSFRFETRTPFCAVTLSSLDTSPISSAGRLLLTTGARVANTDMEWNAQRRSLNAWGKPPVRFEVVRGTLVLTGLGQAKGVKLQPLNTAGSPAGQPTPAKRTDESSWSIGIGATPAVWHVIEVER